ncbi:MlaD family protein [Paraconexibacter algicola]|nr:MlaD family protein [Paraconexibacter algicola]
MLTVLLVAVAVYAAFVRTTPLSQPFEIRGQFLTANQLREGNPVRVAGVDVGRVTGIRPGPRGTSVVVMRLTRPQDVPRHPTLSIRPRLLFEGNFYVDVSPGAPGSPAIERDMTVPVARTRIPVQLDQVFNVLDEPTRGAVVDSVDQLARGLGGGRASGAAGIRTGVTQLEAAADDLTAVAQAAHGQRDTDVRRAVQGSAATATQLAADDTALAASVTDFRRVAGTLASEDAALAASIRGFAELGRTGPADLAAIRSALPAVDELTTELVPALRRAPSSLTATTAFLREIDRLTAARRLPALLEGTGPIAEALPGTLGGLGQAARHLAPFASCLSTHVVPTLEMTVPDGALTNDEPVWKELLHLGANLAASSPSFDGNGTAIRLGITNGVQTVRGLLPGIGDVVSSADLQGVSPRWLGYAQQPKVRPDARCADQPLPDLGARNQLIGTPPAGRRTPRSTSADRATTLLARMLTAPTAQRKVALRSSLLDLLGLEAPATAPQRPTRPTKARPGLLPLPVPTPRPAPVRPTKPTKAPTVQETVDDLTGAVEDVVGGLLGGILGGKR